MKLRYLTPFVIAVFLLSIIVSANVVQAQTQILTETRKKAFINYVSNHMYKEAGEPSSAGTAKILYILKMLDALDAVNVTQKLDSIFSRQSVTVGNQTLWGWPSLSSEDGKTYVNELYLPSEILVTLKLLDVVDRLNRTALIDTVMSRYNASDGAFHEPALLVQTNYGEEPYTECYFPLGFPGGTDAAYANSNMVSTFLAVSILADLDALDMINQTKVLQWVLSSKGDNGAFKPFPTAQRDYLPGWSPLRTNHFTVDDDGTALPFTYAAIGTLRAIGANVSGVVDVNKVRNYVLSCQDQESAGVDRIEFLDFPGDNQGTWPHSTYFAFMTLYFIGALEEETQLPSELVAYLMDGQDHTLIFDDSWPIPKRRGESNYGSFFFTADWTVDILNLTGNLGVLDQPTPIVSRTWSNLITLSAIVSFSSAGLAVVTLHAINRIKSRNKTAAPTKDNQHPVTPQIDKPSQTHIDHT